jgi:hypothetical protein
MELALHAITGFETVTAHSRGDIDGGYGAAFLPASAGPGLIPFPSEPAGGIQGHPQLTQALRLESSAAGPLGWRAEVYIFGAKNTPSTASMTPPSAATRSPACPPPSRPTMSDRRLARPTARSSKR